MTRELVYRMVLPILLFGGNFFWNLASKEMKMSETEWQAKESAMSYHLDSVLHTGWYFINTELNGYKWPLYKTNLFYNIDPTPIVTVANFTKVTLFHEKDCNALIIKLDRNGAVTFKNAIQKAKEGRFAFVVENKLLQVQLAADPQFAKVAENIDPRIYGDILTFPCNTFSHQELRGIKAIIENEIASAAGYR